MGQLKTDELHDKNYEDGGECEHDETRFYSPAEVQKMLGISQSTVYRLAKDLNAIKVGRSVRIPAIEVLKLESGIKRKVRTHQEGDE